MSEPRCELCRREVPTLTRHHLVPRTRLAAKRKKRQLDREDADCVAMLCRPCHKQIHVLFDEKELEQDYKTLAALRRHPEIAKFLKWIRGRPGDLTVVSYRSGRRRRTRRSGPR